LTLSTGVDSSASSISLTVGSTGVIRLACGAPAIGTSSRERTGRIAVRAALMLWAMTSTASPRSISSKLGETAAARAGAGAPAGEVAGAVAGADAGAAGAAAGAGGSAPGMVIGPATASGAAGAFAAAGMEAGRGSASPCHASRRRSRPGCRIADRDRLGAGDRRLLTRTSSGAIRGVDVMNEPGRAGPRGRTGSAGSGQARR
jgi:hypothetical protein